jgi:hypothetical protein
MQRPEVYVSVTRFDLKLEGPREIRLFESLNKLSWPILLIFERFKNPPTIEKFGKENKQK